MLRLDSSTGLPSPMKKELNSAQTEHLYSFQTFSDMKSADLKSPCAKNKNKEKCSNTKAKKWIKKTKSILNMHSNKMKLSKNLKNSRKSTICLQNKNISSESFEKIINGVEHSGVENAVLSSGNKDDKSSKFPHYEFQKNEIIDNKYKVLFHIADGTFGRLVKVRSLKDHKIYAMKIVKSVPRYVDSAKEEAKILNFLKERDKDNKFHVLKIIESFESKGSFFFVFEKLGASLYDLLKVNNFIGYPMKLLQSVLRQMLISLNFLHSLKMTHTDLKPENILFVSNKMEMIDISRVNIPETFNPEAENSSETLSNASSSSFSEDNNIYFYPENDQIKLIDFGGATFDYGLHSRIINTRQYRAPEVILGCCEWNTSSDIWSLGCIVVELYTGKLLFDTHDSYEHLAMIEKVAGNIPFWMANRCDSNWEKNFILDDDYFEANKTYFDFNRNCSSLKTLCNIKRKKNLKQIFHNNDSILRDLVEKMLCINPKKRINCKDALNHDFFKLLYNDIC